MEAEAVPGTGELDPVFRTPASVEVSTALAKPWTEKGNLRPEHSILMHLGLGPRETWQESQWKACWWTDLGKLQRQPLDP